MACRPEVMAQGNPTVDQVSDDGTLVGVEATDPHLGQFELKQTAFPVGHREMAIAGLVQAAKT